MSLLSWLGLASAKTADGLAVPVSSSLPPSFPERYDDTRRQYDPDTLITRQLATAVHSRPDHVKQVRLLLRTLLEKRLPLRRRKPPESSPCPETGEGIAAWATAHVLNSKLRPIPSYGFGLAPVLAHSVAANRQRMVRRVALCAMTLTLSAEYLRGAVCLLAGLLLAQLLLNGKASRLLRWRGRSIVAFLCVLALLTWAVNLTHSHEQLLRSLIEDTEALAVWLAATTAAGYCLDRLVALGYAQSLRPGRGVLRNRPHLAPFARRRIAAIELTETWQTSPYVLEAGYSISRFMGAGREAWLPGAVRIRLTAAADAEDEEDPAEPADEMPADDCGKGEPGGWESDSRFQKFQADELLDRVRDDLRSLREDNDETHPLPHCDVAEVFAIPKEQWKNLSSSATYPWPEAKAMSADGRSSPSGAPARRYLSAQIMTWGGRVVVTVFAHAALEGRTLHFVTRPHVLGPLYREAASKPLADGELAKHVALLPVQALGDTASLALRSYTVIGRALRGRTDPTGSDVILNDRTELLDKEDPVSLREHYSPDSITDMHQEEDVRRHISILQQWMFNAVEGFLEDHGVAVASFVQQVTVIQNETRVYGNNNNVQTSAAGGNANSAQQPPQQPPANPKE